MTGRENRPKAAHEVPAKGPLNMITVPTDSPQEARRAESALTFEDREAARAAGYEAGAYHAFGLQVEDCARALLQHDARKMSDFARRLAAVKGPAWEALIVWSGASDD